jgi:hypothetical protein
MEYYYYYPSFITPTIIPIANTTNYGMYLSEAYSPHSEYIPPSHTQYKFNQIDEVLNLYVQSNDEVEGYFFDFWNYVGENICNGCKQPYYNEQEIKKLEIELTCSICLVNKKTILFESCGHFATCFKCTNIVKKKCPICNKESQNTIRVFLS